MSTLYDEVKGLLARLGEDWKAAKSDGQVTVAEVLTIFTDASQRAVLLAAQFRDIPGAEKKKVILDALAAFYDEVLAPIDLPYVPNLIETKFVDPMIRKHLLDFADQWIERVLVNVRGGTFALPG